MVSLTIIRERVGSCTHCGLRGGCRAPVPGSVDALREGTRRRFNPEDYAGTPAIAVIGEAPGQREDESGQPFVGASGKVLSEWLTKAGNPVVYITNTVKCRPPNNRPPSPEEKRACAWHLTLELAALKPRVIVCLGKHAALSVLNHFPEKTTMGYLVSTSLSTTPETVLIDKAPPRVHVLVAYHPSYYLQSVWLY